MDKVVDLIKFLLADLGINMRRVFLIFLFILGLGLAYTFELVTGYNYYNSLDKKVHILQELQTIANKGVDKHPELYSIYIETVKEVSNRSISPILSPVISFILPIDSTTIFKALAFSSLWILFLIGAFFGLFKSEKVSKTTSILFMFFLTLFFGFLGALIPTVLNIWINYLVFPLAQVIILLALATLFNNKNESPR
jgi:hypothetical protein